MHISCSKLFFRKTLRLCDNTERCGTNRHATDDTIRNGVVEPDRPQMTQYGKMW